MVATALIQGQEHVFHVAGLKLVARRWGSLTGKPVLALHGWLDNCASFERLAPLLDGLDLVCLDMAGHGHSDHRPHLGAYNIWQDISELFAIADQLQWSNFSLLGHSRGAMVAMLAAGTFPSRIERLLMIEGACPRVALPQDAAQNLADSLRFLSACSQRSPSVYASFAEAVAARENGLFPLLHEDALLLAQHGVQDIGGNGGLDGYSWLYDPKLMAGSEVKFSLEQVESFVARIQAPTMLVLAKNGALKDSMIRQWIDDRREHWRIVEVEGGHHLHMSSHCDVVASLAAAHFQ